MHVRNCVKGGWGTFSDYYHPPTVKVVVSTSMCHFLLLLSLFIKVNTHWTNTFMISAFPLRSLISFMSTQSQQYNNHVGSFQHHKIGLSFWIEIAPKCKQPLCWGRGWYSLCRSRGHCNFGAHSTHYASRSRRNMCETKLWSLRWWAIVLPMLLLCALCWHLHWSSGGILGTPAVLSNLHCAKFESKKIH